jgi:hypothetical protein
MRCLFALERSAAAVPIIRNPPSSRHRSPGLSKGVKAEYHFGKRFVGFFRPGPRVSLTRAAGVTLRAASGVRLRAAGDVR